MTWQTYQDINIYFVVSGDPDLLDFSVVSVHIQNDTYNVGGLLIICFLCFKCSVISYFDDQSCASQNIKPISPLLLFTKINF